MAEIQINKLTPDQELHVPAALWTAATFTALDAWSHLVERIYGYRIYRFAAVDGNETVGILALAHIHHPVFGNYLATSPYGSFGGFAFSSVQARDALLQQAQTLANELDVEYTVTRFIEDGNTPPASWIQNPVYTTYLMDLPSDPEDLMKSLGSQHRKHTRQALRKGFTIKFGHLDLLDETYAALSQSMHELGSPYHSKKYLREMATSLGDQLEFVVMRSASGALAGSAVLVYHGDTASNLHANILRAYRAEYAGECLYWNMLEHYCNKGIRICDMGRSLNGSGNETFKMKWRPRKVPLAYWYNLRKGDHLPGLNQKNPKFQFAIQAWKMLPGPMVQLLGPSLIRGVA